MAFAKAGLNYIMKSPGLQKVFSFLDKSSNPIFCNDGKRFNWNFPPYVLQSGTSHVLVADNHIHNRKSKHCLFG